jgi:hypothetical protein
MLNAFFANTRELPGVSDYLNIGRGRKIMFL